MNSLLDSFPTEKVSLYKRNGEIVEEIKALVGSNKFNIDDLSANIEEGDFFIRSLPNGSKEYYCVIDRGFYKGGGGIPDHYQSKVSKVSKEEMEHSLKKGNTKGEELEKTGKRVNKLFISHSSKDGQYVKAFVELLEDIGISEGSII
ncbi:MAG: hypothetical protein J1E06_09865, partial [Acutalibacter sp.]|nr:hypothetical protein [Acutalibacter sp.]